MNIFKLNVALYSYITLDDISLKTSKWGSRVKQGCGRKLTYV